MTQPPLTDEALDVPEGYVMRQWRKGFSNLIGPVFEKADNAGHYALGFRVAEQHTNGMDVCHGGMLMAFADLAFGRVISIQRLQYWVTVRMVTDFISSARVGEWVEGHATISAEDGDFITATGRVWVGDRTVLSGSGLFKCMGARPKGS